MHLGKIVVATIFLYLCLVARADPTPPKTWPATWYTWVVTSIVKVGVDQPLYDYGQLVAYDSQNQYTCRSNQQNLVKPTSNRPVDMCDFTMNTHYMMDDSNVTSNCSGVSKLQGPMPQIVWPAVFLANAMFLGIDRVAQKDCNHFLATNIIIGDETVQMDVWTAIDTELPCEISITNMDTKIITTWAFDGFANFIPQDGKNRCSAPKIMCAEEKWQCHAKPDADPSKLQGALGWVCDPTRVDCTPIGPGGDHYYPNTIYAHCDWAFNVYFRQYRANQGLAACDFAGLAELVPPTNHTITTRATMDVTEAFSLNLVCDRTQK